MPAKPNRPGAEQAAKPNRPGAEQAANRLAVYRVMIGSPGGGADCQKNIGVFYCDAIYMMDMVQL